MSEFMYLFRRPGQPTESPQRLQELMQRWQDWYKELEKKGHLAQIGHPLEMAGTVVTNAQGTYRDGPYAETKDIVGGYSVIRAKDMAEAIALTHGHPVFEMRGMIEVRPVVKL
jgi:hypothetical protein